MKTRFLICSFFLISIFNMKAQENFSVKANVKTEPTDKIKFNETNIGITFTKEIGSKNKITNTLEYSNLKVNYELDSNITYANLDQFNQIQNKFEFSHELSKTTNLNFSITPTVNFQNNLDNNDFTLLGSFKVQQQLSSKTFVSIGVARTTFFGSPKFLPTFSLDYKVTTKLLYSLVFRIQKFHIQTIFETSLV